MQIITHTHTHTHTYTGTYLDNGEVLQLRKTLQDASEEEVPRFDSVWVEGEQLKGGQGVL